ncbi:PREDICTED: uncharacterized protein LOC109485216 [Branchiostoma belcheri]|uniref:Uncharacterized protein LOC109485216 n=1 Tax=Branchiostoma belcheri TaxID=7741 RepID=A0A6P4ZSQ5_BRABE|nr:PREDICTED: uncharacterized protein LOC109485216 [Branchiostoma belcheri]
MVNMSRLTGPWVPLLLCFSALQKMSYARWEAEYISYAAPTDTIIRFRVGKLVPVYDHSDDEHTARPATTPSRDDFQSCQSEMEWPLIGSSWSGWACQDHPQEQESLPLSPLNVLSPLVQLILDYAYPRLPPMKPTESNRQIEKDTILQASVISTGTSSSTGEVSPTEPIEKYRRWDGGERPRCSCHRSCFKRFRLAAEQRTAVPVRQDKRMRHLMLRSCVAVLAVFLVNLLFVEVGKRQTGAT